MSSNAVKLAVIVGSVRDGRFGPVVADWFAEQARRHDDFEVQVVDLAEVDLPLALPAVSPLMEPNPVRPQGMLPLTHALDEADAVVIVTPDINRSYPASIKLAIDWHFTQWNDKPIGFVGYGGKSGGLYAIGHLRQVFNELNAHTVRDYVAFPRYFELFDADGALRDPAPSEAAARAMLDQLHRWAVPLAAMRTATQPA
ncbi:NADPH-dependent FMN reductase [Nocardia spumae]|uniref:NADPH-dependent FMN reductase n=1 Tax=Nocardia spumae TaxID=2887190 RepID=UPI001D14A4CA|nr:NAD(P)H-dependent oxidoreductase [Nocardia spumae]